jgi:hypothetical protein
VAGVVAFALLASVVFFVVSSPQPTARGRNIPAATARIRKRFIE